MRAPLPPRHAARRGAQALVTGLLCVAHLGAPPTARAQQGDAPAISPAELANKHYAMAVQLYSQGRYRESTQEFDKAIALQPLPAFYCNRALPLLKLDEHKRAVESLRACRDTFDGADADRAKIDAQLLGVEAAALRVQAQARSQAQRIALGPATKVTPDPNPIKRPPPSPSKVPYVFIALGGASLASGLTLDLLSSDLRDDFERESQGGAGTSPQRYESLRQDLKGRRTVFYALSGAGVLLTTVGVILLATGGEDAPPAKDKPPAGKPEATPAPATKPAAMIAPALGPGQAGVQVLMRW